MELRFTNIHYFIKSKERRTQQANGDQLEILKGISGSAKQNRLLAILGQSGALSESYYFSTASGSGKTTLLNVLAQRTSGGIITGDIKINGRDLPPKKVWNRSIGYVNY